MAENIKNNKISKIQKRKEIKDIFKLNENKINNKFIRPIKIKNMKGN